MRATRVTPRMTAAPSLGYRVTDRLSLGLGISALYTNFEETIAINRYPTSSMMNGS
jgi:long-subunit fatty acid transport protein